MAQLEALDEYVVFIDRPADQQVTHEPKVSPMSDPWLQFCHYWLMTPVVFVYQELGHI
jgi:hypothetical protein